MSNNSFWLRGTSWIHRSGWSGLPSLWSHLPAESGLDEEKVYPWGASAATPRAAEVWPEAWLLELSVVRAPCAWGMTGRSGCTGQRDGSCPWWNRVILPSRDPISMYQSKQLSEEGPITLIQMRKQAQGSEATLKSQSPSLCDTSEGFTCTHSILPTTLPDTTFGGENQWLRKHRGYSSSKFKSKWLGQYPYSASYQLWLLFLLKKKIVHDVNLNLAVMLYYTQPLRGSIKYNL